MAEWKYTSEQVFSNHNSGSGYITIYSRFAYYIENGIVYFKLQFYCPTGSSWTRGFFFGGPQTAGNYNNVSVATLQINGTNVSVPASLIARDGKWFVNLKSNGWTDLGYSASGASHSPYTFTYSIGTSTGEFSFKVIGCMWYPDGTYLQPYSTTYSTTGYNDSVTPGGGNASTSSNTFFVKHNSEWKDPSNIYSVYGGSWRTANYVWSKKNGVWNKVWQRVPTVIINAGVLETLTISGGSLSSAITVETDTNAQATLDLPVGTYSVYGNVSSYTKTINVTGSGAYSAYPEGAIFWHGNGDSINNNLWTKCGGFTMGHTSYPHRTQNSFSNWYYGYRFPQTINYSNDSAWAAYLTYQGKEYSGSGGYHVGNTYMNNAINTTGYSTIYIKIRAEGTYSGSYLRVFASDTLNGTTSNNSDGLSYYYYLNQAQGPSVGYTSTISLPINQNVVYQYLSFMTSMPVYSANDYFQQQIQAIWLE